MKKRSKYILISIILSIFIFIAIILLIIFVFKLDIKGMINKDSDQKGGKEDTKKKEDKKEPESKEGSGNIPIRSE